MAGRIRVMFCPPSVTALPVLIVPEKLMTTSAPSCSARIVTAAWVELIKSVAARMCDNFMGGIIWKAIDLNLLGQKFTEKIP